MRSVGESIRRAARTAFSVGAAACLLACSQGSPDKLVASAKDYIAKGDNPAAIIQLKNVLKDAPDNGEARYLLGKASLETRDVASAEKELRRALELNQPADVVLPLLARAMVELGQQDALIKDFGDRNLADPTAQATLQTALGDAYLRRGDRASAEKAYAAALAVKGDYAPAQLGRASLIALEGNLDEALAQVDAVIATSPKLGAAHALKGDLLLGKGDRAGARKAIEAAIDADANFLTARLSLIGLLIDDRDFDEAGKVLEGTRKVAPRDLRVNYFDAMLAFRKGDLERARQQLQQVLKLAPDHVPSLVLAGAVDLQEKQYAAAETNLRRAVSRLPNHAGARQLLVQTYLRTGQPVKAREALQPLIERGIPADPRLQLLAGETFLANGDVKRATEFYQAATQAEKNSQVAARTRLGQIALAAGRSEEGFRELEAASELDAGAYQADLALIAGHMRRNELDKAMAAVQALEKKQPQNPLTFQLYGAVYLAKKDLSAARRSFDKALELQPNSLPAAYALAQLDIAAKKPEDARKRYEAMIAKDDKNDQLYLALADLQGRTGADAKSIAETLKRAITANPQSVTARLALISFYLSSKDPKAALTAAQDALAAMPGDPRILTAAGVAQETAGEINQAIDTFNKLSALQPQAEAPLLRLAALYSRQKDPAKAADALKRAQKVSPNPRQLVPQLVQANLAAGRPDEAMAEARELQKSDPKLAAGFALEGDIYAEQRKYAQAEKLYREALSREPKAVGLAIRLHRSLAEGGKVADADAVAKKWIAENPKDLAMRMYLGDRELAVRNLKAAAGYYLAAIGVEPNNVVALNNLAWIGGEMGDSKAIGYAERAFKLAPKDATVLDTYGSLLVKRGDAKGLDYMGEAAKLAPGRYDIRLNYAKALAKAGHKDQARKELEALQALPEDFPGKSDIATLLKSL